MIAIEGLVDYILFQRFAVAGNIKKFIGMAFIMFVEAARDKSFGFIR